MIVLESIGSRWAGQRVVSEDGGTVLGREIWRGGWFGCQTQKLLNVSPGMTAVV